MIRSVRLTDFGPHADRTVDLDSPVVGITGPNGSGKSTVLKALHYAFTGDHTKVGGSEANRDGASSPGLVEVTLAPYRGAPDRLVRLGRRLPAAEGMSKAGKPRFLVDSGVTVTDQAEIKAVVQDWFGVPLQSVDGFVFVHQGTLKDAVSAAHSVRLQHVSHLAGLNRARDVREVLLPHSRPPARPSASLIADLRARHVDLEAKLADVVSRRDAVRTYDQAELDGAWGVVEAARQYRGWEAFRDKASRNVADAERELSAALQAHQDAVLAEGAYQRYRQSTRQWAEYYNDSNVRARIAGLSAVPDPGPRPEPPARLVDLRGNRVTLERLAVVSPSSGCPVCGGDGPDLIARASAARRDLVEMEGLETAYRSASSAWAKASAARRDAEVDLARLSALVPPDRVPRPADPTPDPNASPPPVSSEPLRLRVEHVEGRLAELRSQLGHDPGLPAPDEAEVARAAAVLADHEEAGRVLAELRGHEATLVATLTENTHSLDRALAEEAATAAASAWADAVTRVRDALPVAASRAASSYMAAAADGVNHWLALFDADFRIRVTDDCRFLATFNGSAKPRPAERLSGGQTAVLAVAWRLAVQDMHSDRLWLLCLDEPTHDLDSVRMDGLRDVVRAWRRGAPGRQLVVVTHDRRLADACDKVVDLGGLT